MGNLCCKGHLQKDGGPYYPPWEDLKDGGIYYPPWEDLLEDVLAIILNLTTPEDLARLLCVSKLFRDLSIADSVWQKIMLPIYYDILAQAPKGAPTSTSSKKQVFEYF